jgi:hypothetical protein
MIRLLALLLAVAGPAAAETAQVYSGEHGAFTRLVVELPSESDWTVGRTPSGYAFAVKQGVQPDYDVTGVWQRISRSRASALQVDPDTGALLLSLGCECHVFPFEYRRGAVVLDIKPGPPPAGSAFEAKFHQVVDLDSTVEASANETRSASYNWLSVPPVSATRRPVDFTLPLATGEVSLEPLRDALLEQIARGAADGVVDMGLPNPAESSGDDVSDALPWSSIMLGEHPGVLVSDPDSFVASARSVDSCPDEGLLDISEWGGEGSPIDLLATARSGLFGEFDVADPKAVLRSVQSHLFLGFGAEAAQFAGLSGAGQDDDVLSLYRSMARIVDGETDPSTPFATMLECDGPEALWAALARDRLPAGQGLNRDAILRSYLGLPPHLRAHLGSSLAEKFLALDDPGAVRTIRDAMERTPHIDAVAVALLDAESNLHEGNPGAARSHAEEAITLEGNSVDGLVTLVEAHFRTLDPIGAEVAEALISGRRELGDTELAEEVDRAIVLALALSGQTEAAFESAEAAGKTHADLWRIVLERATDNNFLRHAVLPGGTQPPKVAPELGLKISRRLLALGFPDAGLSWLGTVVPTDDPDRRLTAAMALLDTGDAPRAVSLLAGLAGPEVAAVRAEALIAVGDLTAAREALAANGQTEAAARTSLWQEDWSALYPTAPEVWQIAAEVTRPTEPEAATGPLGRGAQAIEASATSRAAIEALLGSVASPDGG